MNKKFFLLLFAILLVVGALTLTAISPSTLAFAANNLPTKATFFKAIVTTKNLNVRTGPTTNSNVVCVLKNGENVEVYGRVGDWYIVYHPAKKCVGMVYASFIKTTGQEIGSTSTNTPNLLTQLENMNPKVITVPPPGYGNLTIPVPNLTQPDTGTKQPTIPQTGGGQTQIPQTGGTQPTVPKASTAPAPSNTTGTLKPTAEETELLGYVNQARKSQGAGSLQFDDYVLKTARLKARDMVEKNYFSHQSPTYGSPFDMMRQYGITFKTAGENIAGNSSVKGAFDAWMKSEGHRKNILNGSFNLCGFGIEPSSVYGKILVQQFIGR